VQNPRQEAYHMRKDGMHHSSHVEQQMMGTDPSKALNSMLRPEVNIFIPIICNIKRFPMF